MRDQRIAFLQDLTDWLGELRLEMLALVENRLVYNDVREIVASNPGIQRPSIFYEWASRNYALVQTMTLRRLVDQRRDTRSLRVFVQKVSRHPERLSREYFGSLHTPERKSTADRWFDKAAGEGERSLLASTVQADLQCLAGVRDAIKDFTNKKLAHIAEDRSGVRLITFDELEAHTDRVLETFGRYNLMLSGDRPPLRSAREGTDWREIFKRPWIVDPAGQ